MRKRNKSVASNKLVALTRASKVRQTESPATQIAKIEDYCTKNGCEVVARMNAFESGKTKNRDTVAEALKLIREGKAGGIIVTKLDRLARSVDEFCKIGAALDELGAEFVCTDQAIDTRTAEGRFFFHVLGAVAELEHSLIVSRILDGKAHARAQGKFAGGKVPIGFEVNDEGYLVQNQQEQRVIKKIVKWRDEDNCSFQAIADYLTEETGKTWHRNQVVRIYERNNISSTN